MLAAEGVDALILATPAASHLADARLAAGAGLPALVEKPPAPNAAEAGELTKLDPAPWVGFNRRFEPGLRRLRSRVPAEGSLELSLELHHPAGSWGSYVVSDDVLAATGSHLIDLARWLSRSEIERVGAQQVEPGQALLDLGLGRGCARISCRSGAPHRDRVEVRQAGGRRVARYVGDGAFRRLLRRLARPTLADLVALLVRELEEFASASRGGPAPNLASAADGLAVMAVIDAARRPEALSPTSRRTRSRSSS
jgi:predicted dehydrogenase